MEEGKRRNIYIMTVYGFLRGFGGSTFNTLFPLYMVYLGYRLSDIGGLATISNLILLFLIPLFGIISDSYGRKPVIILTGVALAMSLLLVGLSPEYLVLLTAYVLRRFSMRGGQPARGALIAESVPPEMMGAAFGLVTSSVIATRVFIPSLSGYIADTVGYEPAFLLGFAMVSIGVGIFTVFGVETYRGSGRLSLSKALNDLKLRKGLGWLYLSIIFDRFGWSLWFPILNAYIGDIYGLSATTVGILNSAMYGVMMMSQYFIGRWIDRVGFLKGLIISEVIAVFAALALSVTGYIEFLLAGLILTGLSISFWTPSYNKAISIHTEEEYRATEYSKMNMLRSIAAVPAPYLGGYLYDYIDVRLPFTLSAIFFTITTLIFYKTYRREKEENMNP